MIEILVFLVGLIIIAFGADNFSKGAIILARLLNLPRILIGATIVSLATTTPEAIVAILASFQNHSGLALGNALGSPVANLGLILGLVLLFGKIKFEQNVFLATVLLVVFTTFSYILVFWQKTINFIGGLILVLAGLSYLWFLIKTIEEGDENRQLAISLTSGKILRQIIQVVPAFFKLIFGLGAILVGGFLLIYGAVNLGRTLGVSEIFIGLTIIAVGTSLPELALALVSIFKKTITVSVGNLIGASVLTLTLTLGLASVISPVKTTPSVFFFDFPAVLVLSLVFLTAQTFKISVKILGAVFLIFYIFYLLVLSVLG